MRVGVPELVDMRPTCISVVVRATYSAHATRRARHPSSDQLSRSPAGARSFVRAPSPGENSAHLPAATSDQVCRTADPLTLIRRVAASHVKDVAPENGSTTSRHAERSDVVDTPRALQSIGDKEPGEPMLPITLSDCGGCQRRPGLACPDDRLADTSSAGGRPCPPGCCFRRHRHAITISARTHWLTCVFLLARSA